METSLKTHPGYNYIIVLLLVAPNDFRLQDHLCYVNLDSLNQRQSNELSGLGPSGKSIFKEQYYKENIRKEQSGKVNLLFMAFSVIIMQFQIYIYIFFLSSYEHEWRSNIGSILFPTYFHTPRDAGTLIAYQDGNPLEIL